MGRLIDADVLQDLMYHEAFEVDSDMQKWDGGCWIRYKVFENCLAKTPTLVEERRKGKWHQRIYSQIEMMVCSECNSEFSYDAETGVRDYNYCPHCGARMENGDD